jgi:hypothetical protein
MDRCVVDGNQPDRRRNILAGTGNTSDRSAARCMTIVTVLRKPFSAKQLGGAGRRRVGGLSAEDGLSGDGCPRVLESWLGNLVSYNWLERVLCPFR